MEDLSVCANVRLRKQLEFMVEIDGIKKIIRKSKLFRIDRFENDAEHSWTISTMAWLLEEYANFGVDVGKVVLMTLVHDVVELDAGDTFLYSAERNDARAKEEMAAERIFGLLGRDQAEPLLAVWREFEERKTNEAKFASVLDRLEPLLQNYLNEGYTWRANNITYAQVLRKNEIIKDGSEEIWKFVLVMLEDAVSKGYLKRE
jgi:putative hydrolase of HD superfamily